MSNKHAVLSVVVISVFVLVMGGGPLTVAAQGPGLPSVPSVSGGVPGGPGMGGAASIPSPSFAAPSVPQPSPPSFSPPSIQPPSFDPSGLDLPSFTMPSGERPTFGSGGERPRPGQGGQRPEGGSLPEMPAMQWGSGLSPFSQGEDGVWSRFGDRGSMSIPLADILAESGLDWLLAGGFGAQAAPPEGVAPDGTAPIAQDWHPAGLPDDLPSAPAAYEDLTGVFEAGQQAQEVWSSVGESYDAISEDVQANIEAATQAAQQAYDQFWTDYYAALSATAQAYYDAMMATSEAMLEAYMQALDYTMMAVDYYAAYYDQYYAYCAIYPWDCYMYAYDVATGMYYYVGDVSDEPVASVAIGEVEVEGDYPPPEPSPVPSAMAYEAVTLFANDQLGAVVDPLYAGAATAEVQAALQKLSPEIQGFALASLLASCEDYWALVNGGVSGVMTANCPTEESLHAELTSAAAGLYALYADAAMPQTAGEALDLITHVYPALEGLAFAEITDIDAGLAFTATATGLGIDPATGGTLSVGKVIYVGVVEVGGQPLVYTLVAVGQPYVDLIATGS